MSKISQVTIFLNVCDIDETARFYKTIFNFREHKLENKLTRLEKDNCFLMISKVEEPEIITLGFNIEDTISLVNQIENYGDIEYIYPPDSAHHNFCIKDNSGNTIVINNSNWKKL